MSDQDPATARRRQLFALLRWLLLVAVVFGVVAFGFTWLSKKVPIESPAGTADETAPSETRDAEVADFRLAALDGGELGPPDFAGQVVVVDFWATWCGPCRVQERHLEELHTELAGDGVQFLGVNLGEKRETVERFLEQSPHFPYPVLLDPGSELMSAYRIQGLPTLFVVAPSGEIAFRQSGVLSPETIRQAIEEAKKGEAA